LKAARCRCTGACRSGFTNIFRKEFNIVSLERLVALGGRTARGTHHADGRCARREYQGQHPVKFGDGELTIAITVHRAQVLQVGQEKSPGRRKVRSCSNG